MAPINFGIIGTSWITDSYIECAQATGKWNLAAVYSRAEESAKKFAAKYEGQKVALYTDLNKLVNDSNLSAIYIASPNILHFEQAKLALSAGKNVVLEKPSCSTVSELDELFKIAREKDLFLIEAFRHTQEANFKTLKKSIKDLGPIFGASITFAQYSARYDSVLAGETPNVFDLKMGGGALVDLGVYCVSAAIDLFGPPKDAKYWPYILATGADGGGRLILDYGNFVVHLCHSKTYNSDAPSEIYGEKGTLIVPTITDIETVTLWDPKTKKRTQLAGPETRVKLNLQEEAEEHARVINSRDREAEKHYEKLSRDILSVLEKARKDNGLLFPGEK